MGKVYPMGMPRNTNEIGKLLSTYSPSARPGKQIGAGYPCRPHFLAQIQGYIYLDYLFKCCTELKYAEYSTRSAPLRVPQSNR